MIYRRHRFALYVICCILAALTMAAFFRLGLEIVAAHTVGVKIDVYHYENVDGSFDEIEVPQKGRTFEMVQVNFEAFKRERNRPNDRLYISDLRSSLDNSLIHPRWKLPYKPPTRQR